MWVHGSFAGDVGKVQFAMFREVQTGSRRARLQMATYDQA